jgi:hypothetical protein
MNSPSETEKPLQGLESPSTRMRCLQYAILLASRRGLAGLLASRQQWGGAACVPAAVGRGCLRPGSSGAGLLASRQQWGGASRFPLKLKSCNRGSVLSAGEIRYPALTYERHTC